MAIIRPCADLRNKYNEVSKICHETNEPVYITKNGYNDLVILSNEAYEEYEEEKINRLMDEYFDKKFADFEEFKNNIYQKLEESMKDIQNGNYRPAQEVFKEMEEKYKINE